MLYYFVKLTLTARSAEALAGGKVMPKFRYRFYVNQRNADVESHELGELLESWDHEFEAADADLADDWADQLASGSSNAEHVTHYTRLD